MAYYNGAYRGSIFTSTLHTKDGKAVPIATLPNSGGLGLDPSGSYAAQQRRLEQSQERAAQQATRLRDSLARVRESIQSRADEIAAQHEALAMDREPTAFDLAQADRLLAAIELGERAVQHPDEIAILFGNNEIDRFIDPIDLD